MKNTNKYIKLTERSAANSFAILIFIYVFISFILQALLGALIKEQNTLYNALCSLSPAIAIGVVVFYNITSSGEKPLQTLNLKKFNPNWLFGCLALFAGMFFGLGFVNDAFQTLLKNIGLNVTTRELVMNNITDFVVYVITLAVIPAITEEMFFRGLMLSALKNSKNIFAVTITAICFALYHCSAVQFFYQLVFGAGLAILALSSKSVVPCIVTHFINNFFILLLQYFNLQINLYNVALIVLGLIVLSIFALITIKSITSDEKQAGCAKKFFVPFWFFGLFVCLLIIITNLIPV